MEKEKVVSLERKKTLTLNQKSIMHLWKVTLTHVGIFSRIPVGTTIYVKSERTDKPDCDDVKQAFIDKFGTYPTGTVSWYYTDEF